MLRNTTQCPEEVKAVLDSLQIPLDLIAARTLVLHPSDGVAVRIVSAFRSVDRQAEIVRDKLARGLSLEAILCVSAPPGYSEHHSGRAVDVTTEGMPPLEVEFEDSAWR